jgi:hypothetical protein
VKKKVLYPGIVCIVWRRREFLAEHAPAYIIPEQMAGPVAVIEESSNEYSVIGRNPLPAYSSVLNK